MSFLKFLLVGFCMIVGLWLITGLWKTRKEKFDKFSHRLIISLWIGIICSYHHLGEHEIVKELFKE